MLSYVSLCKSFLVLLSTLFDMYWISFRSLVTSSSIFRILTVSVDYSVRFIRFKSNNPSDRAAQSCIVYFSFISICVKIVA